LGGQPEHFPDVPVSIAEFRQVQIAHTLPEVINPEISESTTWVVEYCLPFKGLGKYDGKIFKGG
jgi:hypothetical protein